MAFSYLSQAVAVAFVASLGIIFPQRLDPVKHYIAIQLTGPAPIHRDPAPAPKPIAPVRIQQPVATLRAPAPAELPRPKPPELAPVTKTRAELLPPVASAPKAVIVKTGAFSTGSSAPPTVSLPAHKVQTGGFGDPNGVPGEGKAGAKLMIARVGSFELPFGPGQGNGTGGARGVRGAVASAGFGNGIATGAGNERGGSGRGTIQQGGFGDSRPPAEVRAVHMTVTAPVTTPVEIISKPKPVYTEEARRLRLEGEVLLDVTFEASGQVQVRRVIRGLGHGLDEAAMRAAQQIRFHPAKRDGQPVDFTAALHVIFQLAY